MNGLKITEVARRVNRHPNTLRKYERLGLIPKARRDPITNWRYWKEEDILELRRVLASEPH